ncbi:gliding motility-associated C-terminal domain-containing protein [Pedobacter frigoris]|uniref:gliding motility-associated C-terminal domain-containing protein n=1 Tax=Pedobacter frigoris TaxID=2571272 RepID=UPI00292F271D|nr:gliding motility-associated C-terminal domain-containing protein [Pedobacter frigoris]
MKYRVIFFLILLFSGDAYSQIVSSSIVNSSGNTSTNGGITYEWSVGEMAIVETMVNTNAIISNGFLQGIFFMPFSYADFLINPTNILSPNGDGKNDVWIVEKIEDYPDNEVTVFDRSGRIMFNRKNYQNDWTANVDGKALAEGTYYYVIRLKKGNYVYSKKGFITIIK